MKNQVKIEQLPTVRAFSTSFMGRDLLIVIKEGSPDADYVARFLENSETILLTAHPSWRDSLMFEMAMAYTYYKTTDVGVSFAGSSLFQHMADFTRTFSMNAFLYQQIEGIFAESNALIKFNRDTLNHLSINVADCDPRILHRENFGFMPFFGNTPKYEMVTGSGAEKLPEPIGDHDRLDGPSTREATPIASTSNVKAPRS